MDEFAVSKRNLPVILAGIAVTALGYLLMAGGGSDDPQVFSTALYSFVRITLSPILIVLGFAVVIVGIMRKPGGRLK